MWRRISIATRCRRGPWPGEVLDRFLLLGRVVVVCKPGHRRREWRGHRARPDDGVNPRMFFSKSQEEIPKLKDFQKIARSEGSLRKFSENSQVEKFLHQEHSKNLRTISQVRSGHEFWEFPSIA